MKTMITLQRKVASGDITRKIKYRKVHSEIVSIPLDMFVELEADVDQDHGLLLLKGWYVKHHLVPYFDLLHEYDYISVGVEGEFDRVMNCRHKRSTLTSMDYPL